MVTGTVQHGRHSHRGPFAVIQRRSDGTGWAWEVVAPMLAGIGGVPWQVYTHGEAPTWGEALRQALGAAGGAREAFRAAERRIPRGSGPLRRPWPWQRR